MWVHTLFYRPNDAGSVASLLAHRHACEPTWSRFPCDIYTTVVTVLLGSKLRRTSVQTLTLWYVASIIFVLTTEKAMHAAAVA